MKLNFFGFVYRSLYERTRLCTERINRCSDELRRLNPTSVSESGLVGQSDDDGALCDVYKSYTLSTKLLIGADGSSRTVANAMEKEDEEKRNSMNVFQKLFGEKSFKVKRYIDDNVRCVVRQKVMIHLYFLVIVKKGSKSAMCLNRNFQGIQDDSDEGTI